MFLRKGLNGAPSKYSLLQSTDSSRYNQEGASKKRMRYEPYVSKESFKEMEGGEKEARIEGKKEEEGRKASFSVGSFGSLSLEFMFIANTRMFARCF